MRQTAIIVTIPGMIEEKDWQLLSKIADIEYVEKDIVAQDELLDLIKDKDYLMLNFDVIKKLDENFYKTIKEKNFKLKALSTDITGMDWASPQFAKKYGIKLLYIPSYSTISVAEFSLTSLLIHVKKLHLTFLDKKLNKKEEPRKNNVVIDKTLGIVGLGEIGTRMAEISMGVGMKIVAYNRSPKNVKGVEQVSLEDLFKKSDYISIHLKNTDDTVGLINEKYLSLCKDGVIIINQASGRLIDKDVLLKFIKMGKIAGYSCSSEGIEGHPLADEENVTAFPAQAWFTDHSLNNLKIIWIENILNAMQGKFENLAY